MKKNEVKVGGVYTAKVSDKLVEVRIDGENRHGGWNGTNLATGKKIHIKSPARLRGVAGAPRRTARGAQAGADGGAAPTRRPLRPARKRRPTPSRNPPRRSGPSPSPSRSASAAWTPRPRCSRRQASR